MSKNIKIIIVILAIIIIAGILFYTNINRNDNEQGLIGGQADDHGCLGPAGYSWCQSQDKCLRIFEEFCPDAVTDLIDSLNKVSGVTLTSKGESEFAWVIMKNNNISQVKIPSVLYSADNVKTSDYEKIEQYMKDNFEMNDYNIADGPMGGLRGYYGNYMACIVFFQKKSLGDDNLNVTLQCGYFNKNEN
ncbi:hypothetical protein KJ763_02470 [Patescibacteria group bacterium]|nr:hypothetical protein [Patescibacteria group bacterium]